MKYTTITKLVIQMCSLFAKYIREKINSGIYFQYKILDKKQFRIMFVINSNDYTFNEQLVTKFIEDYSLTQYVKIEEINHIKAMNTIETDLTVALTNKAKRSQADIFTFLLMKDR